MFKHLRPMNGYILIDEFPVDEKTASGLIIPKDKQQDNKTAKVIHAGDSIQIKNDATVFYKAHFAVHIEDDLCMIKETDILGLL